MTNKPVFLLGVVTALASLLLSPTLAVAASDPNCSFGPPCSVITSGSGTITVDAVSFTTDVISGTVTFPPLSNESGLGQAAAFPPAREFVLAGGGLEAPLEVQYSAVFPVGEITHSGSWPAPFVFDAFSAPAGGPTVSAHGDGTVVIDVMPFLNNMLFAQSATFTFGAQAAPEPSTASLLLIALAGLAVAGGRRTFRTRSFPAG